MLEKEAHIIPAIIPKSLAHLSESLALVFPFTCTVQVDIVDGVLVPFTSWPYIEDGDVAEMKILAEGFDIEIDLMVQNPEEVIEEYLHAGAKRVVVHLESTTNIDAILAFKNEYNFLLGFSILNDTDMSVLVEVLPYADYVQLMGIKDIGSQGQPFDTRVIERVRNIKQAFPNVEISIDGSMNAETIPPLVEVGATRFAVGSAIMGAQNPEQQYETFTKLIR